MKPTKENIIKLIEQIHFLNNVQDKRTFLWNIGTDFYLYFKRFQNLLNYLHSKNVSLENDIFIKMIEKGSKRYYFSIEEVDGENNIINAFNLTFIEKDMLTENIKDGKLYSWSVWRQTLDTWASSSFVYPLNKQNSIFKISLSEWNYDLISTTEINNFIEDRTKEALDLRYINGIGNWRDIIFTIIFHYSNRFGLISFEDIKNLKIPLRESKKFSKKLDYDSYKKTVETQTTIKNSGNECFSFLKEVFSLVYNWSLEGLINTAKNIENFKIDERSFQNRPFQSDYRKRLLTDEKRRRGKNDLLNVHDLINDVYEPRLVDACHILDVKLCQNEKQKTDLNNGLLLDPMLHKYYDKDLIIFDQEGLLYVKNNFLNQIKKIFPEQISKLSNVKLHEKILTSDTIWYINERNRLKQINMDDYIPF